MIIHLTKNQTIDILFTFILFMTLIIIIIHIFAKINNKFKKKDIIKDEKKILIPIKFNVGDLVKMDFFTEDVNLCIGKKGLLTSYGIVMKINNDNTCNIEWRKISNEKYKNLGDICKWDKWGNNEIFTNQYFGSSEKNPNPNFNNSLKSINIPFKNLILIKPKPEKYKIGDKVEYYYRTNETVICGGGDINRFFLIIGSVCGFTENNKIKINIEKIINTMPFDGKNYNECSITRKKPNDDTVNMSLLGSCGVKPIAFQDLNTIVDIDVLRNTF